MATNLPKTNVLKDKNGNSFDASIIDKGVLKQFAAPDLVELINGNVIRGEALETVQGTITGFRYYRAMALTTTSRTDRVRNDQLGLGTPTQGEKFEPVVISVDDELEIRVFQDKNDNLKLLNFLAPMTDRTGSFVTEPLKDRQARFCENLRASAKWGNTTLTPIDNLSRIRVYEDAVSDVDFAKMIQKAKNDLMTFKDEYGASITDLSWLFLLLTPYSHSRLKNTQSFTGGSRSDERFRAGWIGDFDGIDCYLTTWSEDIDYLGIRGAVATPIANPKLVQFPSASDEWKGAMTYNISSPIEGKDGKIMPERVIAFTKNAALVNAPIRKRPTIETINNPTKDVDLVVNYLKTLIQSLLPFNLLPQSAGNYRPNEIGIILPTGFNLRETNLSPLKVSKVDAETKVISVEIEVSKGTIKKTATWEIKAKDAEGAIVLNTISHFSNSNSKKEFENYRKKIEALKNQNLDLKNQNENLSKKANELEKLLNLDANPKIEPKIEPEIEKNKPKN